MPLRLSQAESILARLSEADARAYYDLLRRRVRKVIVMRALALIALLSASSGWCAAA